MEMSIYLSIYLSICLSIYTYICIYIHIYIHTYSVLKYMGNGEESNRGGVEPGSMHMLESSCTKDSPQVDRLCFALTKKKTGELVERAAAVVSLGLGVGLM